MKKITFKLILFSYLFVSVICYAEGTEKPYGLVKEGSFLLSEKPNIMRDNLLVHSLVAYLPTGTRVRFGEKKNVTNLNTSEDETYYSVKSELGVEGLIREDLLIQANGRKLAVSIAGYDIPLHQPNSTLKNPKVRLKLGRYGGNFLELTGETVEGFYDVTLHRPNYKSIKLPKAEKARLKKVYIEKKQVAVLDPENALLRKLFDKKWKPIATNENDMFKRLIDKIKDKVGNDFDKIETLLGDINNLQCLSEGSVNGELGFKVFANGFSLEINADLKQKGLKYTFESNRLIDDNSVKYYSGIGVIQCNGVKPFRLLSFTIQENIYSAKNRFSISLADLNNSKSKWIITLQDEKISNKMVRISGWNEYNQLMRELNEYAKKGSGYLSRLSENDRIFLLNYIISRIAFFEHRDLIID